MTPAPGRALRWLLLALLVPALLMPRGLAFSWCGCEGPGVGCCEATEELPSCCAGDEGHDGDRDRQGCCESGGFAFDLEASDAAEDCGCCQAIEFDLDCDLAVEKAVEHALTVPVAPLATAIQVLPPASHARPAPPCRAPPDDVRPPGLWPGAMPMRR